MVSFDDDDENDSGSENNEDVDETMDDVDDADADADVDADAHDQDDDGDGDDDGDEGDNDEDDGDDAEGDGEGAEAHLEKPQRQPSRPPSNSTSDGTLINRPASNGVHPSVVTLSYRPPINPDALTASVYDIVPTIAAPQGTSINTVAATPDMRWVFSGGSDGYIRKFNWPDTVNGKLMLTVAQRHPFVDSVVKAGVLASYWENEDAAQPVRTPPPHGFDEHVPITPVYSLAVQHQGLWLLSGGESGGINLLSVRHSEGTRITTLRKHTSAVSVLNLADDERSVLSGSWDKTVVDWDLNTGAERRVFDGSAGQISTIELRPTSSLPVPREIGEKPKLNGTFSSNNAAKPRLNGVAAVSEDTQSSAGGGGGELQPEDTNLAGDADAQGDADDLGSLFGDDDDAMVEAPSLALDRENGAAEPPSMPGLDDDDDEFSRAIANGLQTADDEQTETVQEPDIRYEIGDVQHPDPLLPAITSETTDKDAESTSNEEKQAEDPPMVNGAVESTHDSQLSNGTHLPRSEQPTMAAEISQEPSPNSPDVFLDAAIDGTIRIWDRRAATPIARILPKASSPWCMTACWSPDGNCIYAGRRNGTVDEYNLHKGFKEGAERVFRFPGGSGPVSAVKAMPNGRHLICASYDILRLYDLKDPHDSRHSSVPFLIVPGHRTGIISQLFIDPTCRFLISAAGNRGWDGNSTEVLLGYEIGYGT